jgi:O-antigen ligase
MGVLGAVLLALGLTFSRTCWIGLAVGVLTALWLRSSSQAVAALLALSLGLLLLVQTQAFFASSELAGEVANAASWEERLNYWPFVFGQVAAQPFGAGLGTVGGPHVFEEGAEHDLVDPLAGRGAEITAYVTDNSYLKLFIQGGLPLLAAFLLLVGAILRCGLQVCRSVAEAWAQALAVWALASFAALLTIFCSIDFMEAAPSIALYWLAVGVLCRLRRLSACYVKPEFSR